MSGLVFLAGTAATEGGIPISQYTSTIIPILLVFVVFYFFLIRPEKKRKKIITEMRESLKIGDEITTIGGIIGKITNIKDEQITIETGADKNKIRVMRWAISTKDEKDTTLESQEK